MDDMNVCGGYWVSWAFSLTKKKEEEEAAAEKRWNEGKFLDENTTNESNKNDEMLVSQDIRLHVFSGALTRSHMVA